MYLLFNSAVVSAFLVFPRLLTWVCPQTHWLVVAIRIMSSEPVRPTKSLNTNRYTTFTLLENNEVRTFSQRNVLWRSFLSSLFAHASLLFLKVAFSRTLRSLVQSGKSLFWLEEMYHFIFWRVKRCFSVGSSYRWGINVAWAAHSESLVFSKWDKESRSTSTCFYGDLIFTASLLFLPTNYKTLLTYYTFIWFVSVYCLLLHILCCNSVKCATLSHCNKFSGLLQLWGTSRGHKCLIDRPVCAH